MTNDTAKAILAAKDIEVACFDLPQREDISVADLQAMARLWLCRDDLRDAVTECLNEAQAASYQRPRRIDYYVDLLAKLSDESLQGEI